MRRSPLNHSPARKLMELIWTERVHYPAGSWLRINSALGSALFLTIDAGLSFDETDFKAIYDGMRGGYWIGERERFYTRAVELNHRTACASYEAWLNRKPFRHCSKRVAVDCCVDGWADLFDHQAPKVTSFHDDGEHLTAVTYKPGTSKIAKRFTITREELAAHKPAVKPGMR